MPLASRTGEVKYRIKGKPGADAYNLITTVSQVYQTATGTFNPNSFTAYAYQGKELAIGMYLQCWGSSDNENWTYISYRQITSSNTGLTVNVRSSYKYYIVRLYDHNPSTNIDAEPNFLASATVPVIKDGEPGAQGNPGAKMRMRTWASGTYYMRGVGTEEWYDVVEYESRLYLCRVSHTASSSNSPATDTGYWETAQNWTFIATKLLLAEKIKANMIDADGITAKNVNLTGEIIATSGNIGGFAVDSNSLICKDGNARLQIEVSGERFFRLNSPAETAFMRLRADNSVCVDVTAFGASNEAVALRLLCNSTGYGKAIDATGNVRLIARPEEWIIINGLSLNSRTVTSSANIQTNDDIIIANNSNDITLYLSDATSPGKMIYIKRKGTGKVTVKGNIINQDVNTIVTSLDITDYPPRLFFCHGATWFEFSGRH